MTFLPPKIPPTPKQAAQRRALRLGRALQVALWTAAALPILFLLMAYGYSDQAPTALRDVTISLDGALGQPVWRILSPKG